MNTFLPYGVEVILSPAAEADRAITSAIDAHVEVERGEAGRDDGEAGHLAQARGSLRGVPVA